MIISINTYNKTGKLIGTNSTSTYIQYTTVNVLKFKAKKIEPDFSKLVILKFLNIQNDQNFFVWIMKSYEVLTLNSTYVDYGNIRMVIHKLVITNYYKYTMYIYN